MLRGMQAIAFVLVLTLAAAGLWYGGRAWLGRRRGAEAAWLPNVVDGRRGLVLLAAGFSIVALLALGLIALLVALLG